MARDRGDRLDDAQLNQIVTSTWATREGVRMEGERLTLSRNDQEFNQNLASGKFQWEKYTYRTDRADNSRQWEAEHGLRVKQVEWGFDQDRFGNAMTVLNYLQQERSSIRNVSAQDRSTLTMYGQTLRATVDDARAEQRGAAAAAVKLAGENVAVTQGLASGAIYKDKASGTWMVKPGMANNAAAQEYANLRNYERDQQAIAESGVGELNMIKGKLLPEQADPAVQDLYASIFGENSGAPPTLPTVKPGQQVTLDPTMRAALTAVRGERGSLIQAALSTMDEGLVNPATGQRVETLDARCSQTLRLLADKVGLNTGRYFGADAKATWGLLQKNGQVIAGGRALKASDAGSLQAGDMLYQDFPPKDGQDPDHIAMYLGNGLVYQHNSFYQSKTGQAKGNINVMTLEEFVKLNPTRAARIPELGSGGAQAGRGGPAATPRTSGTTPPPSASFTLPKIKAGSFKPNVTNVSNRDMLGIPNGNGLYNLINDTGVAVNAVQQVQSQVIRQFGAEYKNQPLAKRRAFMVDLLTKEGYRGNLTQMVSQAIPK